MEKDRAFTDKELASVSDHPEWTAEEMGRARPFAEAFPDLAASLEDGVEIVRRRNGRRLSINLSGDVAAYYESFGDDAEARLNADLRKLTGLGHTG